MVIDEIFPNPTVKQVVFQIRFPNLFFIEGKIGDLQMKIMEEFPESALLHRRQIVFADIGPGGKLAEIPSELERETGRKIWQFKSEKDFQLNVLTDSLDITSKYHKTYNQEGGDKFRDAIRLVLDSFFEVAQIPTITRIGLRYVDECPIPSKDDDAFKSYYDSVFPFERFSLADADEMSFRTVVKRGKYYLCYQEILQKAGEEYKLVLDFDGFGTDIPSENCLAVADSLHAMISEEFEKTIKEPVKEYMRQSVEDSE